MRKRTAGKEQAMKVEDVITNDPVTIGPETLLENATSTLVARVSGVVSVSADLGWGAVEEAR
jgi:hypothetical protein